MGTLTAFIGSIAAVLAVAIHLCVAKRELDLIGHSPNNDNVKGRKEQQSKPAANQNKQGLTSTIQCYRNGQPIVENVLTQLTKEKFVVCDSDTDGGGWIVIQRRVAGDVDFYKTWNEYKQGFGSSSGDFWIGNDWISTLTQMGFTELRFDMKFQGQSYHAVYNDVIVGNETYLYWLNFAFKEGNTKNDFEYHNGMYFSTHDRDHDFSSGNCAVGYQSGWWFKACFMVHLNGEWASSKYPQGIVWTNVTTWEHSLDSVEMKLRRP